MGAIRLLLALCVVEFHSTRALGNPGIWPVDFPNGVIAVQAFYVISGFYMALVLSTKYAGEPLRFYRARAMRLLPVYWLVLIATVAFDGWSYGFDGQGLWAIISNVTLIGSDWNVFLGVRNAVSPAWTLGVELTFYAVAPLLILLRSRWLFALMLVSIGARLIAYRHGMEVDPWLYRFFPFELAWFLAGMLAYRVYVACHSLDQRFIRALGWLCLAIFVASILYYPLLWSTDDYGAAVKFMMPFVLPFVFALTRDSKIDAFVGEFSYPVYICHFLVLGVLTWLGVTSGWMAMAVSLLLAAILLLATSPIERARAFSIARTARS